MLSKGTEGDRVSRSTVDPQLWWVHRGEWKALQGYCQHQFPCVPSWVPSSRRGWFLGSIQVVLRIPAKHAFSFVSRPFICALLDILILLVTVGPGELNALFAFMGPILT
jgi:hypothetical protein